MKNLSYGVLNTLALLVPQQQEFKVRLRCGLAFGFLVSLLNGALQSFHRSLEIIELGFGEQG